MSAVVSVVSNLLLLIKVLTNLASLLPLMRNLIFTIISHVYVVISVMSFMRLRNKKSFVWLFVAVLTQVKLTLL
ncbi:hypothetical protein EDC96DRAFT_536638 [Choanephora cucurbitarum]|nr:hypothetical protein EDC96DRAFT_536638 [Choanephora cucurbitarum]